MAQTFSHCCCCSRHTVLNGGNRHIYLLGVDGWVGGRAGGRAGGWAGVPGLMSVGSSTWPRLCISSKGAKLCKRSLESATCTGYVGIMLVEVRVFPCWDFAACRCMCFIRHGTGCCVTSSFTTNGIGTAGGGPRQPTSRNVNLTALPDRSVLCSCISMA